MRVFYPELFALIFSMLVASYAPCVAAEDHGSGTPKAYEEAVARAFTEFDLQNYAEARSLFLAAHRINPNARTLRALGMVEYELKNYVRSIAYLEQALATQERRLTEAQRSETEALLTRARAFVGRYRLVIQPVGATVSVNGESVAWSRQHDGLSLQVGEHALEVQAPSHRPFRRKLHVEGGEAETIHVTLVALEADTKAPSERSEVTPLYKKWWLWTAVGVVVAGGVAAAVIATQKQEPQPPSGGSTRETIYLLQWGR